MSISIGFYDIFANTIPGFLYLYLIVEFLRSIGWRAIDITQVDTIGGVMSVVVASFILGNIIGSLTYRFWYKLLIRKSTREVSLVRLKKRYPELRIEFDGDDNDVIFAVVKHHDKALADKLEAIRASSIMMRNISLGLFFYAIWQFVLSFTQQSLSFLAVGVGLLVFSVISLNRSFTFGRWFFDSVFLEALNYGGNVREVLSASQKIVVGKEIIRGKGKSKVRKQK